MKFSIVILGPGHQAIVSHEALVCTLGSAAVETAVDSTSRLDSSTVLRRGKSSIKYFGSYYFLVKYLELARYCRSIIHH